MKNLFFLTVVLAIVACGPVPTNKSKKSALTEAKQLPPDSRPDQAIMAEGCESMMDSEMCGVRIDVVPCDNPLYEVGCNNDLTKEVVSYQLFQNQCSMLNYDYDAYYDRSACVNQ